MILGDLTSRVILASGIVGTLVTGYSLCERPIVLDKEIMRGRVSEEVKKDVFRYGVYLFFDTMLVAGAYSINSIKRREEIILD